MLLVAALPPVADAADNNPAPTVPQTVASIMDKGQRWHIEREVLLKPGQLLRVWEDIKGNRRKGAALSSEMDLVLEDLVRKGLGRLVRDDSRKKYFLKTRDIPTDDARHYSLTADIYCWPMARSNNSRLSVLSDSVLCHQDTGSEVGIVDLAAIATPPRPPTKKTSSSRKRWPSNLTPNDRFQAKASKARKGVRFLDPIVHDGNDEDKFVEVSPWKKGCPNESRVAVVRLKRLPPSGRRGSSDLNDKAASQPTTSQASPSEKADIADEDDFVKAWPG